MPTADRSCKARLFLAAALTPYRGITCLDAKKKERSAVDAVIRDGLKLGTQNHYLDGIPPLFTASELLKSSELKGQKYADASQRVAVGT
jgi:tRNA nucleotidyltransferase (CCA-adding enzyme)